MRNALVLLIAAALTGCSMQQEPCCASYPIKAFKATYQQQDNKLPPVIQTWLSDGKGHALISHTDGLLPVLNVAGSGNGGYGTTASTIIDYNNGSTTLLDPNKKMAYSGLLTSPWISNGTAEQTNATALGDKNIDGHLCKGWKVTADNAELEYWLGEDTGCYVLVSAKYAGDKEPTSLKLISYEATNPDPANFQIPRDYISK